MSQFSGIWAVVEVTAEGQVSDSSLELLNPARALGDQWQQPVTAVFMGTASTAATQALAEAGADAVLTIEAASLSTYQVETYTAALSQAIAAKSPAVVLLGASSQTSDFAPRVAIRSGSALITNVSILEGNGAALSATRSCFAESLLSSVSVSDFPALVTIKKKAYAKTSTAGRTATLESFSPDLSSVKQRVTMTLNESSDAKGAKKLEEADIVVSGGRGLKEAENFKIVEDLASAIGAAVGASRAVVDAGWRPHSEQVGQTGKTVSPKLYFALGISGAIQHLVGMNGSHLIIAVNRDENAPIFKTADFGVVGDAITIIPELTRAIQAQNLHLHV